MSLLKRNIAANLIGNGWSAVLSIIFIPLYIHYMGIESYGLIGIHVTLMTISTALDLGMSPTINREMARLTTLPDKGQEAVNLVRTMEIVNWIIAAFIGLIIILLSNYIAYSWLKPGNLTAESVQQAICLMGISIVFQWTFNFYSGGLIGLQKQFLLNSITAGMTTLRSVGAILVLWLISPTIQAFLAWHIAVNALQFFTLAISLKTTLPQTEKPASFQLDLVHNVRRFAAGMGGISIMSMIFSQMDKFILSKLLTLETFGYYTLASVVATSFSRLMGPLVTAIFPRFVQLITLGDIEKLKQLYHSGCQMMSVLIMPFTLLLVLFSKEMLLLWTQDSVTSEKTALLVSFLALATMFNGLAHLPLSLEYAFGRTRTVFYVMLVMLIVMAPAVLLSTRHFGVIGAAVAVMMVNIIYTLTITNLFHNRLLVEEKRDWYVRDVGIPMVVALSGTGVGRLLVQGDMSNTVLALSLTAIAGLTIGAVAYSVPFIREWLVWHIVNHPRFS